MRSAELIGLVTVMVASWLWWAEITRRYKTVKRLVFLTRLLAKVVQFITPPEHCGVGVASGCWPSCRA